MTNTLSKTRDDIRKWVSGREGRGVDRKEIIIEIYTYRPRGGGRPRSGHLQGLRRWSLRRWSSNRRRRRGISRQSPRSSGGHRRRGSTQQTWRGAGMSGAAARGTGGAAGKARGASGNSRAARLPRRGSTPPGATCKLHSAATRAPVTGGAATVRGVAARGAGRPRPRPPGGGPTVPPRSTPGQNLAEPSHWAPPPPQQRREA